MDQKGGPGGLLEALDVSCNCSPENKSNRALKIWSLAVCRIFFPLYRRGSELKCGRVELHMVRENQKRVGVEFDGGKSARAHTLTHKIEDNMGEEYLQYYITHFQRLNYMHILRITKCNLLMLIIMHYTCDHH